MSFWARSRARAQRVPGIRIARFAPVKSVSRSRATVPAATLSAEADLLSRFRGPVQPFVAVPSYGELVAQSYEDMEAKMLAYVESNR